MKRDKFKHRRHADDVDLEPVDADHAVLTDHTVHACPADGCRYFELDDWELDHDVEPSLDVDARLDELSRDVDLPVYQVVHCSGMTDPKKAFPTHEQAEAWVFGHYNGPGNRSTSLAIRKTYSRTAGSHTQRARKKDYPMVYAVVNTALDPDAYGYVVASNLVPRPDDYPDSAQWKSTPSVKDVFQYHLDPPDHIVTGHYGDMDRYNRPDGYDGDALQWFVEQVEHYEVVVQTPDLFLDADEQQIAAEHATDWTPPRGDA